MLVFIFSGLGTVRQDGPLRLGVGFMVGEKSLRRRSGSEAVREVVSEGP